MNEMKLTFCLLLAVEACAHTPRQVLVMDTLVVSAGPVRDLPTDIYDADTVLHYAREAERQHDYAKGQRLNERLIREFPESKLVRAARFGRGRCIEAQTSCEDAMPIYQAIRAENPEAYDISDWVDAHFRSASCELTRERAREAVNILTQLLAYPHLSEPDQLEGQVGRGIAFKELNLLDDAEVDFMHVLAKAHEHQEPPPEIRFTIAKASYHLGEVNRLRFEQLALAYPMPVLEQRIEDKSQYLLRAQLYYLRAIRLGDLEAAAASGYRVGGMYEHFHEEIVKLEAPTDLTHEQVAMYNQEVRNKVSVLLRKAVKIYEEACAMAQRTGLKSSWIERMQESLERIKKLYLVDISS
jgi:tetratricopeptide (TPR) repeat protein